MKIHRIDHIGIIVNNLPAVKAFFIEMGLEILGETKVTGEWAEQIYGLRDVRGTVVWLGTPNGQVALELVKLHTSSDETDVQQTFINTLGNYHIAFAVEDIEAIVERLKKKGVKLFGEIQIYEDAYKLCYIRGPEGIVLELAEKMN